MVCRAMEEMREEAREEERLKVVQNLMKNLNITAEESMEAIGVTEEEKRILMQKIERV